MEEAEDIFPHNAASILASKRIGLAQALAAIDVFQAIRIRLSEIDLAKGLELAERLGVYAYDAYVIECALRYRCLLISLNGGLMLLCASC